MVAGITAAASATVVIRGVSISTPAPSSADPVQGVTCDLCAGPVAAE